MGKLALFGKLFGLLVSAFACAVASADRLINIPTAKPLTTNGVRFEHFTGLNDPGVSESYAAFSAFNGVEFEARRRKRSNETGNLTFDVSYNVVGPVPSTSPGIAFGVLDLVDETLDGRRAYLAFTFRELLEVGDFGENGDFTFGFQAGRTNGLFVGTAIPLSPRLKLLADWNGVRLTSGIEINPSKGLSGKLLVQDNLLLASISFTRKIW